MVRYGQHYYDAEEYALAAAKALRGRNFSRLPLPLRPSCDPADPEGNLPIGMKPQGAFRWFCSFAPADLVWGSENRWIYPRDRKTAYFGEHNGYQSPICEFLTIRR